VSNARPLLPQPSATSCRYPLPTACPPSSPASPHTAARVLLKFLTASAFCRARARARCIACARVCVRNNPALSKWRLSGFRAKLHVAASIGTARTCSASSTRTAPKIRGVRRAVSVGVAWLSGRLESRQLANIGGNRVPSYARAASERRRADGAIGIPRGGRRDDLFPPVPLDEGQ